MCSTPLVPLVSSCYSVYISYFYGCYYSLLVIEQFLTFLEKLLTRELYINIYLILLLFFVLFLEKILEPLKKSTEFNSKLKKFKFRIIQVSVLEFVANTAQKMKFSIKNFFSKCDEIRKKLRIWSHLLKKSLMENFIFGGVKALETSNRCFYIFELKVRDTKFKTIPESIWWTINTITTVGYGDMTPSSTKGKIFGAFCSTCSILILALPVSVIGNILY